ncbi:MAG: hypothetical protein AB7Q97_25585 [Gammaproteobacteria bacterium]
MKTNLARSLCTLSTLLALILPAAAAEDASAKTRAVMRDVFDAIAYLLPLSLRGNQGATPDEALVNAKLDVLTASAKALADHAGDKDREFGLLARSFEHGTQDIRRAFDTRYPAFASYALMDLTQHCAACHSRLPDQHENVFGQRLMARMNVDGLAREELAQLYVATRQFDHALEVYEKVLLDRGEDPIDLDLAGVLVEYMRVSIGVRQDFARPRQFLKQFLGRPDLPFYLRQRLQAWDKRMAALGPDLAATPSLALGRRIFASATAETPAPEGRERVIDDVVAASVLRRYLQDQPRAPATERAEAYYLLGVIVLRTTGSRPLVPEMELLFEAAIRTAPNGQFARTAYALLEEYGFVNQQHLARTGTDPAFIDMPALRRLIGI